MMLGMDSDNTGIVLVSTVVVGGILLLASIIAFSINYNSKLCYDAAAQNPAIVCNYVPEDD